ncbi:ArnT family glycosyltransferase [Schlesneria paludicola]|uniref:ArnT family glycosyltransferase n=1 Tax=Schlesneria paludicola TaxID=360056 RepID=UPI00029A5B65|nr:glycosyltransferase family 39 protein [Schlesneria paludicola]
MIRCRNWFALTPQIDSSSAHFDTDQQRTQRIIGWLIGLGLLARVVRYYLCFPLWDDESFLCVNFISRSFAELLRPLDYHQVAPVLFLWIERALVKLFGFSEYALRLFPFVCSIASLFVFRRVAEKLLSGPALIFAIAMFAVSYPGIRYAAEAKPYGSDMFVSLVMLSCVVDWFQRRDSRILILLAVAMPIVMGVSYPAVFAAGGMSLVVAAVLLTQHGSQREWLLWAVWNASLVASFVTWFSMVGRVQNGAEAEFMGAYWKENFPPIAQPWLVPYWLLKTHASDFLAYPFGGPKWASSLTLIVCLMGLWSLAKRRLILILGLLLAPAGLHLLAAALQKYPYGGHVKFSQHLAPMICCLGGVGLAQLQDWIAQGSESRNRGLIAICTLLVAVGGASIGRDLISPYKTRSDFRARAFAQSFWAGAHYAEEVVCVESDLGFNLVPDQHRELSWCAHFICNRAIEVSRASLRPADVTKVSATRPLRCVLYRDARYSLDQDILNQWLADMQQDYELVAHESVPFPRMAKNDRSLITMEHVDSYKFIPRDGVVRAELPFARRQTAASN